MSKECCNICCDTYNKSTRGKICCGYCEFAACRLCCETYILSETIPKCMNPPCAKEWSRKFIRDNFTDVFINTKYRGHLESVLFDQEKALLPASQLIVEEKIRKEKVRKQMGDLDLLIQDLYAQKRVLERTLYTAGDEGASKKVSNYVRACPADGCRGFLSSQWKCGICEQWTCPQCHELKGLDRDCDHNCDPNNVETAKLLDKDTKPCPKCQTKIFKISGCDQIWCTQCHTAFSWKTGALEKNIHNPHYYEWQRRNGGAPRVAGDIECGRELTHYTMDTIWQLIKTKHTDLIDKTRTNFKGNYAFYLPAVDRLVDIIRHNIHNIRYEIHQYQTDYVVRNQDLRVQYLCNEISEEWFKLQIQRNDKKNRKNNEIAQVIQLSHTAATDIVYRILDDMNKSEPNKHNLEGLLVEFEEIIRYCNEIFRDIGFAYNSVQYAFDDKFRMASVVKEKKLRKKKDTEMVDLSNDSNDPDLKSISDAIDSLK